ncbi:MAG: 23S rRNA (adenine(2503)-C(2))-methyltransferase RlmN [Clostridia bacterium]|nr:23S rRNA (adenine(2503)-C(2))-methyltransferase RlmN [Clostridia bacterium]
MINAKDFTYDELSALLMENGEKSFRAGQVFKWLHSGVTSFDEMTNVPKSLWQKLPDLYISVPKIEQKLVSADGTVKYLWRLADGECIESVVMNYEHGYSICISTQAGCSMGCKFCASTIGGKIRDLTPGEIEDQIIFAGKDMGVRISNVVLMGIGEPLDNYDNVIKFIKNAGHEKGLNIGMRHITLSSCGLVDKMYALADEELPITLSVSLHAPTDEIRRSIMPVANKYTIEEIIKACKYYIHKTGRRVSFEYTLIKDVNDSKENAKTLASLVKGMQSHINLIPVNEARKNISRSTGVTINVFKDILLQNGVNVTIRRTLGGDINASCGQLRNKSDRSDS